MDWDAMMVRQEREIMEKMDVMDLQEEMEVAEMEVGGGVPLPGFRAMGEMEIQEALAELEVEGVQEGVKIAELDPHASFVGPVEVEVEVEVEAAVVQADKVEREVEPLSQS